MSKKRKSSAVASYEPLHKPARLASFTKGFVTGLGSMAAIAPAKVDIGIAHRSVSGAMAGDWVRIGRDLERVSDRHRTGDDANGKKARKTA